MNIKSLVNDKVIKNLPEKYRDSVKWLFDNVYEKIDDAVSSVVLSGKDIKYKVENATQRIKDGYAGYEVWNFGDYILIRMADICGYLYDGTYYNQPNYLEKCLDTEKLFRAIDAAEDFSSSVLHTKIADMTDTYMWESKGRNEDYIAAWEWIFDTLFNPDVYVAPLDVEGNIVRAKNYFSPEISYDDVKDLPISEMKRISSMLSCFAKNINGHAVDYAVSENAFLTIEERGGEKWENGQSLAIGLLTHNDGYWKDQIWEKEETFVKQKTRKELGVDWVAWIEDVLHAAEIFRLYVEWFDKNPKERIPYSINPHNQKHAHLMSLRENMMYLDEEEAKKIEEEIVKETKKVWMWIGKIGRGFWD